MNIGGVFFLVVPLDLGHASLSLSMPFFGAVCPRGHPCHAAGWDTQPDHGSPLAMLLKRWKKQVTTVRPWQADAKRVKYPKVLSSARVLCPREFSSENRSPKPDGRRNATLAVGSLDFVCTMTRGFATQLCRT